MNNPIEQRFDKYCYLLSSGHAEPELQSSEFQRTVQVSVQQVRLFM